MVSARFAVNLEQRLLLHTSGVRRKLGASAFDQHILASIPHEGSVIEHLLCQWLAFPENKLVGKEVQRWKVDSCTSPLE